MRLIWDHPLNTYALREREGVKAKAYIYCFYDIILLFKSAQGGRGCMKITKFEHTYFMDSSFFFKLLLTDRQDSRFQKAFTNNSLAIIKLSKTKLSKMVQLGGFSDLLDKIVGPTVGLPLQAF